MVLIQVQMGSHNFLDKLFSCIAVKGTGGLAIPCIFRLEKTSISGQDVGKTCLSHYVMLHVLLLTADYKSSYCMLKKKVLLAILLRFFCFCFSYE